jgi:hypothetical protein
MTEPGRAAVAAVIQAQYLAALAMLGEVVERCPDSMWTVRTPTSPFWRIAYHALVYTHLYLQPTERDFVPWAKHRAEHELLGPLPWPPHRAPAVGQPYSRAEVLEYLERCREEVAARVPTLDLTAASGFSWLPFGKLELQFYSIRHIQQHVGELADRLGVELGVQIDWVGTVPRA